MLDKVSKPINIIRNQGISAFLEKFERYLYVNVFKQSPILGTVFTVLSPVRPVTITVPTTKGWAVWELGNNSKFLVPNYMDAYRGTSYHRRTKFERYTLEGFSMPNNGDTVVEVGAFRGEFTIQAAMHAECVIALEPDPYNMWYLLNNTERTGNVEVAPFALWNESNRIKFKQGRDPTESSLINIDAGGSIREILTPSVRLDEILSDLDIETVDYLKIDAEGAEPEVIEGAREAEIRKIAVDCGPERYGKRTNKEVIQILRSEGYEIKTNRDEIVFARRT
jgi:FkbM family methyltransferase